MKTGQKQGYKPFYYIVVKKQQQKNPKTTGLL